MAQNRLDGMVSTQAGAAIGIQLGGNARIGTFVQGIDAEIATRIVEALDDVSRTLVSVQRTSSGPQWNVEEDPAFQAAVYTAQRLRDAGQVEAAGRSFLDALELEERFELHRQNQRRQLRMRLLEEGLAYDTMAGNAEGAFVKLRLIAEAMHPSDRGQQARHLIARASEYQFLGATKGDKTALLIAVSVFGWLAKEAINVER